MTPVMSIKNTAKYFAVGKFLNKYGAGQHYLFFGWVLKIFWARVAIYPGERRSGGFFDKLTSRGKFLSTGIVSHVMVYLSAAMRRQNQTNTKFIHSVINNVSKNRHSQKMYPPQNIVKSHDPIKLN